MFNIDTNKLLVLDVEGTIIHSCGFDERENQVIIYIDQRLPDILKKFKEHGFTIVIATGTDGQQLEDYRNEFITRGFDQYIDAYKPNSHDKKDHKSDKLQKYEKQFNVEKGNIFFFDDGPSNISQAKNLGFQNSYQVTEQSPLTTQLEKLYNKLFTIELWIETNTNSRLHIPNCKEGMTCNEMKTEIIDRFGLPEDSKKYFKITASNEIFGQKILSDNDPMVTKESIKEGSGGTNSRFNLIFNPYILSIIKEGLTARNIEWEKSLQSCCTLFSSRKSIRYKELNKVDRVIDACKERSINKKISIDLAKDIFKSRINQEIFTYHRWHTSSSNKDGKGKAPDAFIKLSAKLMDSVDQQHKNDLWTVIETSGIKNFGANFSNYSKYGQCISATQEKKIWGPS